MEFDLADLLKMIKRRLSVILIVSIIGVATTAYISFKVLKPQYAATTTLLVQSRGTEQQIEYNDLIAGEKLLTTYGEVVRSKKIAHLVIQKLNLPYSDEELLKRVRAEGIKESQILAITVLDQDPLQAVIITNSFATTFKENLPTIMKVENVSILDRAFLSDNPKPVTPRPYLNMLIVFLVVFSLGSGMAIVFEVFDKTIKSESEIKNLVNLPVLANVPLANRKSMKGLFCIEHPKESHAEVFRTLRTNLKYVGVNREMKVLMVTSPLPSEGKTTIISNLAAAMVQDGKKVLIVDCDLRKPALHKIFEKTNEKGLSDYLVGNQVLDEIITNVVTNMSLLTAGPIPPNPSELISLRPMEDLLIECKGHYDIILLDSPPVIPVTDAQILSKLADGVLLIVRSGKTSKETILKAKGLLEHVGADLIGTVLNGQKLKLKHYYRY